MVRASDVQPRVIRAVSCQPRRTTAVPSILVVHVTAMLSESMTAFAGHHDPSNSVRLAAIAANQPIFCGPADSGKSLTEISGFHT